MLAAPAHAWRRRSFVLVSLCIARWSSWSFVMKPSSSISSPAAKSSCRLARHQFLASVLAGSAVAAPRTAWSEASEDEKKASERIVMLVSNIKERQKMAEEFIEPLQDQLNQARATYKQQVEPLQAEIKEKQAQLKEKKKAFNQATKPLNEQIQKERKAFREFKSPLLKEIKELEAKLTGFQRLSNEVNNLDLKDELFNDERERRASE
mmetsp:Transcript_67166/g.181559  ORF Transcript_67166/g.181559 Transcript_67166/m.181559 type:complete len:208 (+) Transcript_67166:180-803(+)